MATTDSSRPDRSAAVKDGIRAAARRLFISQGFDATGIRDIATEAGVNPAIVIRHFGSKEQLFIETVDASGGWQQLLDGPIEQLGTLAVRRIMANRHDGLEIFGVVVRASGRPEIRARLQASTIAFAAEPLVQRITAPDAELRAHLFGAQLIGLITALVVYADPYLLHAPIDRIVDVYGASLQHTLSGTRP